MLDIRFMSSIAKLLRKSITYRKQRRKPTPKGDGFPRLVFSMNVRSEELDLPYK